MKTSKSEKTSERLAVAFSSCKMNEYVTDALSASGVSARRHSIGRHAFISRYSNGNRHKESFNNVFFGFVLGQNKKLKLTVDEARKISSCVLKYWYDTRCQSCDGRGFIVIDQITSKFMCDLCSGTGRKIPQNRIDSGFSEWTDAKYDLMFSTLVNLLDTELVKYLGVVMKILSFSH